MKDCEVCGNEIPEATAVCRFCGSPQRSTRGAAGPKDRVRTVNLEAGRPTVDEALERLEGEMGRARMAGARVIRLIHGWGSSGTGGKLRDACRTHLRRILAGRQIRGFVAGDDYATSTVGGRELMGRHPELRKSERTDSRNPGITLVEL